MAKKTSQYGLIIQAKLKTQKTQVMSSLKTDVATIQGYLDTDKTSKTKLLLTGKINISETKKQINEQLSTLKNLPTIKLASVIDTSGLTSQVRKALEAVGIQGTVQKYSPKEITQEYTNLISLLKQAGQLQQQNVLNQSKGVVDANFASKLQVIQTQIDATRAKIEKLKVANEDYGVQEAKVSAQILANAQKIDAANQKSLESQEKKAKTDSTPSQEIIAKYRELVTTIKEFGNLQKQNVFAGSDKDQDAYGRRVEEYRKKITELRQEIKNLQIAGVDYSTQEHQVTEQTRKSSEAINEATEKEAAARKRKITQLKLLKASIDALLQSRHKLANSEQGYEMSGLSGGITSTLDSSGLSSKELNDKLQSYTGAFRTLQAEARNAGVLAQGTFQKIGAAATKFMSWMGITTSVAALIRQLKQVVTTVSEIDNALGELRVVTNASKREIQEFTQQATEGAKRVGSSVTELIDSAVTFARLGNNTKDSGSLAEITAMFSKAGAIDVSEATSAITAIVKAYGYGADELQLVLDKIFAVDAAYAISSQDIGEGLRNAGSALATAGNSIEQSMALLVAANNSIQDIDKASTALRTITARIRSSSTELDELGETMEEEYNTVVKYRAKLKAITGVDILEADNKSFKDTYQILKEISNVFDSLSDKDQASVIEMIAGTRNQNVFASIMKSMGEADQVLKTTANAAGSLNRANEIYLDTVEGKTQQFKATYQEFAQSVMDSDLIKGTIDTGSGLLGLLTKINDFIGPLTISAGALGATLSAFKDIGFVKGNSDGKLDFFGRWTFEDGKFSAIDKAGVYTDLINDYNKAVQKSIDPTKQSGDAIAKFLDNIDDGNETFKTYLKSLKGASASTEEYAMYLKQMNIAQIKAKLGSIALNTAISMGIGLLITGAVKLVQYIASVIPTYENVSKWAAEAVEEAKTVQQEVNSITQQIETNNETIKERQNLINSGKGSLVDQDEISKLQEENKLLLIQLETQRELLAEKQANEQKKLSEKWDSYNSKYRTDYSSALKPSEVQKGSQYSTTTRVVDSQKEVLEGNPWYTNAENTVQAIQNTIKSYQELIRVRSELLQKDNRSEEETKQVEILGKNIDFLRQKLQDYQNDFTNGEFADSTGKLYSQVQDLVTLIQDGLHPADIQDQLQSMLSTDRLSQVNEELQKLATNSQLTGEALQNAKFESFVNQCKELGIITDTDNVSLTLLANTLLRLYDVTESAAQPMVALNDSLTSINDQIDGLQSAFSTLSGAVEEYNTNGWISVDTLQSLMSLDEQYLDTLLNTADGLSLNTDQYAALMNAKLDDMELQVLQNAYSQMQKVANDAEAQSYLDKAAAMSTTAEQAGILLTQMATLYQVTAAMGGVQLEAMDQIIGRTQKYLNLIEKARSGIGKQSVTKSTSGLEAQKKALNDLKQSYQDQLNTAKQGASDIESLISYVIKMISQGYEDTIKGLETTLDQMESAYKKEQENIKQQSEELSEAYDKQTEALKEQKKVIDDLIDQQLELLDLKEAEDEYNKSLTEKQTELARLEAEQNALAMDTSDAGGKRKLELQDEINKKQQEIYELQHDRDITLQKDALNAEKDRIQEAYDEQTEKLKKEYDAQKEALDKRLDLLEQEYEAKKASLDQQISDIRDYVSNETNLRKEAIDLINAKSSHLYADLIAWNTKYGSMIDADIKQAWDSAYDALGRYTRYGQYDCIYALNQIAAKQVELQDKIDAIDAKLAPLNEQLSSAKTHASNMAFSFSSGASSLSQMLTSAKDLKSLLSSINPPFLQYLEKLKNLPSDYGEAVSKSLSSAAARQEKLLQQKYNRSKAYASGTRFVPTTGYHLTQEDGEELIVRNQGRYTYLERGDGVITSRLTDILLNFASNPAAFIASHSQNNVANNMAQRAANLVNAPTSATIRMGDIIIQGSADQTALNKIRSMQENAAKQVFEKMEQLQRRRGGMQLANELI